LWRYASNWKTTLEACLKTDCYSNPIHSIFFKRVVENLVSDPKSCYHLDKENTDEKNWTPRSVFVHPNCCLTAWETLLLLVVLVLLWTIDCWINLKFLKSWYFLNKKEYNLWIYSRPSLSSTNLERSNKYCLEFDHSCGCWIYLWLSYSDLGDLATAKYQQRSSRSKNNCSNRVLFLSNHDRNIPMMLL